MINSSSHPSDQPTAVECYMLEKCFEVNMVRNSLTLLCFVKYAFLSLDFT